MKKYILLLITLTFLNTSFAFQENIEADLPELSVGWNLWYPYQFYNKQNKLVGLDIDIAVAVAKEAGYRLTFTELPWKRHLQFVRTGIVDIAMGTSPNDKRKLYARFTKPYRFEQVALFVRKGTKHLMPFTHLADIIGSPFMIGAEDGYYYGEEFESLSKLDAFTAHIGQSLNLEHNMSLLMNEKIDGVFADDIAMLAFAKKYKLLNDIERHSIKIHRSQIHFMVSKKTDIKVVERFSLAIDKLKANGTIDRLINQWTKEAGDNSLTKPSVKEH